MFVLKIYHLVISGRNKNSFFLEVRTTSSSLFRFSDVAPLNTIFYSKSLNNMNGSQKINKHPKMGLFFGVSENTRVSENTTIGSQDIFLKLKYGIKFVEYSLNGVLIYVKSFVRIKKQKG